MRQRIRNTALFAFFAMDWYTLGNLSGRMELFMYLRRYRPEDCPSMAALFFDTVHTVNARDYTPAQLDAWADGTPDLAAWDSRFRRHLTLIAQEGSAILGYADMDASGYLDHLYVHRDAQRQGVATALCDALEAAVPGPWTTHASLTARPFFEKRGYRVLRSQQVERHGILLTNSVMEKSAVRLPD